jgi:hypothetical protein
MQLRHRVPAVFTLYMVDVFCCALGCVILLWLVSARDARRRADERDKAAKQLAGVRLQLSSAAGEAAALRSGKLAAEAEGDQLRAGLAAARAKANAARHELEAARKQEAGLSARLRAAAQERDAAAGQVRAGEKALAALREDLRDKAARLAQLSRDGDEQRAAAKVHEGQAAALRQRVRALEKDLERRGTELAEARLRAEVLADLKQKLDARVQAHAGELAAARAEVEKRFAGVSLTGERVVFLLDMSGSMKMRDPLSEDASKWGQVCETVARLLEGLPSVKRFQVIAFSDRVRYPLGGEGRWLGYDPKTTPRGVAEALKQTRPEGETNLHAAFAEAFRYRPQGMDTIYLLSDGLPTAGEGAPPGLKEAERAVYLGRHVRQTLKGEWNRDLPGQPRVRINTVGFYFDTPEVGAFLWALAREHDGNFVGLSRP